METSKITLKLDSGRLVDFFLVEENNGISVKTSSGWYLVTFKSDGTLERHRNVDEPKFFQLTKSQRIRTVKD